MLDAKHPAVLPEMVIPERSVPLDRLLPRLTVLYDVTQLATEAEPKVKRRPDPLGRQGQAVAGRVADEEDAVLDGRSQLVRDPVALPALRGDADVLRELQGRLLDVVARVERADADAQL